MAGAARQPDIQRNSAFFLGAFGTTLGVLGGVMAVLGIVAQLFPDFAQTAPDWVFAIPVFGLVIGAIGAWPALDWLVNQHPRAGAPVIATFGLVVMVIGGVAVTATAWDLAGWLALAGGLLLLPAAGLALAGGGTEPLTWRSLRTERVQRAEARLDVLVSVVFAVATLASLGVLAVTVALSLGWPALGLLALAGALALGWQVRRRRVRG